MNRKSPALALCALMLMASAAQGGDLERSVFGWVEKAELEPDGIEVKAKLDTGALTSSLHAEDIRRFDKHGEEWVRFTTEVVDEDTEKTVRHIYEKPVLRNLIIRGAGGQERRPVVLFTFCMGDTYYEEQVSLEDRDDMNYPLLIGRRTIQHLGLVDVTETFLHQPGCDEDSEVSRDSERGLDEDIGV